MLPSVCHARPIAKVSSDGQDSAAIAASIKNPRNCYRLASILVLDIPFQPVPRMCTTSKKNTDMIRRQVIPYSAVLVRLQDLLAVFRPSSHKVCQGGKKHQFPMSNQSIKHQPQQPVIMNTPESTPCIASPQSRHVCPAAFPRLDANEKCLLASPVSNHLTLLCMIVECAKALRASISTTRTFHKMTQHPPRCLSPLARDVTLLLPPFGSSSSAMSCGLTFMCTTFGFLSLKL